jgi:DNA-directed RNA polymerase II subunit RPB1
MGDTIIGVQFGIANPIDIVNRSVVELKTDKTFTQRDQPVSGGVFDSRFGVTEHGKVCPTCKQTNVMCPGHFGHIRLARPVYLYQFLDVIQKLLNVVCMSCSNPYLPDETLEKLEEQATGIQRFNLVREATTKYKDSDSKNSKGCSHCGGQIVKKTSKLEGTVASLQIQTYDDGEPIRIQPELVLRCFERITDRHVELLGFNPKFSRPDWMICTVLAVPPLTVRPSVVMDDNQRSEDDLTHQLITIVGINNQLREKIDKGETADIINKYTDSLQFNVATYVDNDIKGLPQASQRSGRPLKTLKTRLGAKEGRVRGNLMGKRVDFSARSVITPDPNIDLDELGVPEEIAMNLTFPEMVTQYNRDRLMVSVRNGPTTYPGAKNIVLKQENRTIRLGYVNKDLLDLKEGDIVHRHLVDGDVVLFNRQPSLHKASMMCHRIRVLPYSTFRLNVSATKPYNADFDGDEMNMHVPQSIASATELRVIATILRQIVSPRTCSPIIGVFQDTLTGVFRISQKEASVPEHLAMNMLARMKKPLSSFKRTDQAISGVDIISNAFPLMNFKEKITIKDGKLVDGVLNKDAFGKSSKGIVHVIYNDFGSERAGEFINSVQNIVTKYNLYSGFSTGPSDLIADEKTYEKINEVLKDGMSKVSEILASVHAGRFVNTQGRTAGEELEMKIVGVLGDINTKIGTDSLSGLSPSNRMLQMSNRGANSKGSAELNITQMVALLGQQNVDGKRIKYTMNNRTLPHFTKFDDGPESRGFVEKSYIAGIRPSEFFFHAMGGREGLIDTAVKTSDTGYIQRKLVKLMEDIHVEQDSTVRDINSCIVQFSYGEDGIDAIHIENHECNLSTMTMEQVYSNFAATREDFKSVMSETVSENPPDMVNQILADRDILVKHVFRYTNNSDIRAPVHLMRIINTYRNNYSVKTDLTPEYVVDELTKLCSESFIQHNQLFHILLRFNLCPKKSIIVYRFSKDSFDEMIREIRFKYMKALVHAGEMVGPLAAQSIGEPATQLTLNTFHSAGTVKANATQGVPRIQELLSVSHNPKNPSNVIYLKPEMATSKESAMKSMKELQKTTLRDVTKSVRIYHDPNPMSSDTAVLEDRELLQTYEKFSVAQGNSCMSPWIMRLELDPYELAYRHLADMTLIQTKIRSNKILKIFDCIHTDTNSSKLVLRIVFGSDIAKNALSLRFIEDKLLDTILTGVDGIGRVFPRENKKDLVYSEAIGGYEPLAQWVLDTEGTNLFELFMNSNVDATRTFSDDIYEILDVFGIETARMTMYEELMKVFESEYINYHHVCLLVDAMTYHGRFIAIDRFGMSKLENGVLAKSSFEQTAKILFDAAVGGEFDNMKGVSANIMFGQRPPCGTGLVDILIDETRLPEGVDEEEYGEIEKTNKLVNAEEKKDEDEGQCRMDDIEMAW